MAHKVTIGANLILSDFGSNLPAFEAVAKELCDKMLIKWCFML